jgi:hypothetical protein
MSGIHTGVRLTLSVGVKHYKPSSSPNRNSDNSNSLSAKQGTESITPVAIQVDSEHIPGAKMNMSNLLRYVAHGDPQFHVIDGSTYMVNKGVETRTKR